jgi:hypothetical protein
LVYGTADVEIPDFRRKKKEGIAGVFFPAEKNKTSNF